MNKRVTGYVPIYSSIFLPKIIILTTLAELKIVHNHLIFPLFVPYFMCLQIASNISEGVFTCRASNT